MRAFFRNLFNDFKTYRPAEVAVLSFMVFAVYGIRATVPTPVYDFAASKGGGTLVFLTHFFMRRWSRGIMAACFQDFSPLWNAAAGLAFFLLSLLLMGIVVKRLGFGRLPRMLFLGLWAASPFLYNISVYQHALPATPITLCFDAVALLLFLSLRDSFSRPRLFAAILCTAVAIASYQAHANLLLTAFMGICLFRRDESWRPFFRDISLAVSILAGGVLVWALLAYGPVLLAEAAGIHIPPSGGAHDAVYWFTGEHSFSENLSGLLLGIAANWGYNAFSIIGLRFVWLAFSIGLAAAVCCAVRRRFVRALSWLGFALSIFAFPVLQCASVNIRTFLCFIPLTAFTALALWRPARTRRAKAALAALCAFAAFSLGHETATLNYYHWKVKDLDTRHMMNIATDIWRIYGLAPKKPVMLAGGLSDYGTVWHAMRPHPGLPILGEPFSMYTNVSSHNCPREFFMIAREQVGLVIRLPSQQERRRLGDVETLIAGHPAYPRPGYIYEQNGVVIVNLGDEKNRWPLFRFRDFRSPNEILLFEKTKMDRWESFLYSATEPIRRACAKRPWSLER